MKLYVNSPIHFHSMLLWYRKVALGGLLVSMLAIGPTFADLGRVMDD